MLLIYINIYELDTWSNGLNGEFAVGNCLFGAVKLTKNSDPENTYIATTLQDLIIVQNFHGQMVAWENFL